MDGRPRRPGPDPPERREALVLIRRRLVLAQALYVCAGSLNFVRPVFGVVALGVVQLFFIVSPRLPVRV